MSATPDQVLSRAAAVLAASIIWGPGSPEDQVSATARRFAAFIAGARLTIRTDQRTWRQVRYGPAQSRPTSYSPGGSVQLHDFEQVRISLDPEDIKGYDVRPVTCTYTPADPAVVTAQPSDDTLGCLMVAGAPGSTTVDITIGGTFHATWAADVLPGDVAKVNITEGTPERQPGF